MRDYINDGVHMSSRRGKKVITMNINALYPVVPDGKHVFPVLILPVASQYQPSGDDEIEDDGAEIDDDEDDDDIGNPYDDDNLPEEDAFGDEDYPSEDEDLDDESFDHIVEEGDEEADNVLNGEVPSRVEQYELDDEES